jgi:hypothetical protein
MGQKITDKLNEVAESEEVRSALNQIFLFEIDQGSRGVQYKKDYRGILERFVKKNGDEDAD